MLSRRPRFWSLPNAWHVQPLRKGLVVKISQWAYQSLHWRLISVVLTNWIAAKLFDYGCSGNLFLPSRWRLVLVMVGWGHDAQTTICFGCGHLKNVSECIVGWKISIVFCFFFSFHPDAPAFGSRTSNLLTQKLLMKHFRFWKTHFWVHWKWMIDWSSGGLKEVSGAVLKWDGSASVSRFYLKLILVCRRQGGWGSHGVGAGWKQSWHRMGTRGASLRFQP